MEQSQRQSRDRIVLIELVVADGEGARHMQVVLGGREHAALQRVVAERGLAQASQVAGGVGGLAIARQVAAGQVQRQRQVAHLVGDRVELGAVGVGLVPVEQHQAVGAGQHIERQRRDAPRWPSRGGGW